LPVAVIADIDRFRFASSRVAVFHVFWRRNALNVWRLSADAVASARRSFPTPLVV
jgi:hypothetical protein